ncbi:GNAT family N-acetyltransferase [Methanobrevibacter sp. DSM 116169]|uniref:GNAT family N-acetyltransferase n=1 Tax=Methanobrevibacter sp. DSM 116169 TaxID=3242727 RepID=UPI0038FC2CD9
MKIEIKSLKELDLDFKMVKDFLFNQIKKEYGYGYVPNFHEDIINLKETYIDNNKNNFFIAIDKEKNKIIGSIAIRGYDKDFKEFEGMFSYNLTSSIWRLFVDNDYRRLGIGRKLVEKVEIFSKENDYIGIYLHTHKTLKGALDFWTSLKYDILIDTENELKTVHMFKNINNLRNTLNSSSKIPI